jgi:hypothetical protein
MFLMMKKIHPNQKESRLSGSLYFMDRQSFISDKPLACRTEFSSKAYRHHYL